MSVLKAAYPSYYRDFSKEDAANAVALWSEMFADDDFQTVKAAVKAYIAADAKGFPPTIGAIKASLLKLTQPRQMTEQEAWNCVRKAVGNGMFGAEAEFEALPPTVRRIVGSPALLREWALMSTDTLQTVVASNFQRSYRAMAAAERELKTLPADIRRLLGGVAGQGQLCDPHDEPPSREAYARMQRYAAIISGGADEA